MYNFSMWMGKNKENKLLRTTVASEKKLFRLFLLRSLFIFKPLICKV